MQLQHLTQNHLNDLFSARSTLDSEYITLDSGVIERAPTSTQETYRSARAGLSSALKRIPDLAMIELQALAWYGRGDAGSDFKAVLDYSATRFDHSSREYLASKRPLCMYIENGLNMSGAVLAS